MSAVITNKITRVQINHVECDHLLREPGGAVYAEIDRITTVVMALAKGFAPKETGKGAASITTDVHRSGLWVVGRVLTDVPYMRYQETGTGPIYPKKAKMLRFVPKGGNHFVFAKKTKGVPETKYMRTALKMACPGWKIREEVGGSRGKGKR